MLCVKLRIATFEITLQRSVPRLMHSLNMKVMKLCPYKLLFTLLTRNTFILPMDRPKMSVPVGFLTFKVTENERHNSFAVCFGETNHEDKLMCKI